MSLRLLLLSNSTNAGQNWLEYTEIPVKEFLGKSTRHLLFFPFAGVITSMDSYAARAGEVFNTWEYQLDSVHSMDDPRSAIKKADGYVVGGGNTWHLVARLYELDLMDMLRKEVKAGKPYIGWSAGANIACPTMMTTNDMPLIRPPDFVTLGLIPFQINPHFLDANPEGHQGETREQRILEFIEVNRGIYVVGLREGSILQVEDKSVRLLGRKPMRVFRFGKEPFECTPGDDLSFLMRASEETPE